MIRVQKSVEGPKKTRHLTPAEVDILGGVICDTTYNYTKAKICNIIEASISNQQQCDAAKKLVSDVLDEITRQIRQTIDGNLYE